VTVEGTGNTAWFDATRETDGRLIDDPAYAFTASNSVVFSGTGARVGFDGAGTVNYTGTISGNGSLVKTGSGDAVLTAANTFVGGVQVSAGRLLINEDAQLGNSANIVTLAGGTLASASGVSLTLARNIQATTGGLAVASGDVLTLSGALSGTAAKQGSGTLTVSGTTTNGSFDLAVDEGVAVLDKSGASAVRHIIRVASNAVARLSGSGGNQIGGTLEVSGVIDSGTNPYELVVRMPNDVGGILLLSTNNVWLGTTWIRCGTIRLGIDNALPPSTVLRLGLGAGQTGVTNSTFDLAGFNQRIAGLADVGTDNLHDVTNTKETFSALTIDNTTAQTFAGEFKGKLNVVKTGSSTLTLSGVSSTYGGLLVSNGSVVVSATGSLGPNSTNITVAAGTLTLQTPAALADAAALRIANGGGAKVSLAAGVNESVGYLYFGDKLRMGGTYGATGSGARTIDDEHFAGSGILTVLHGNGGTVLRLQ